MFLPRTVLGRQKGRGLLRGIETQNSGPHCDLRCRQKGRGLLRGIETDSTGIILVATVSQKGRGLLRGIETQSSGEECVVGLLSERPWAPKRD